ncbi:hypothetical protein CspeluHIS016_0205220 [Cutaneotrichosporon spelunceum]|uniref:Kinesin motor domain-containing protein n=1 Tax=Cutaneotrichosporon spelunceum TaxID=1672016 RepID=A0AAD3TR87_9TREE|nr:hypothetical protein CspeluHIS016_0205220 [Cutaneotrichosporon spelunceum]
MASGNNIKVVCRFRPMNRMEAEAKSERCVAITDDSLTVAMKSAGSLAGPEKDGFTFDRVFDEESTQQDIFDFGVKSIVEDVMTGFNGTLFCYGQTGSGKTFTMMGADIENAALKGLIPRITEQIFASIVAAESNIEYTVKVSYMEIYMEKIKDLLAPHNDNLSIHEDKARGVYVKGVTDVYVASEAEVFDVMRAGGASRAVSSTNMNAESSRSHSIFVIGVHQRNTETGSQKSGNLYLVDLAGSEKVGKTGASGQTLEEAKKINKSLSALGMSTHIPYRDSKLTRILQESLGGNSRTTLIINCSPASFNEPETLSTLRFGMRAKSIRNKARVNVELSPAELRAMLKKLTAELGMSREYAAMLEEEVKVWRSGGKVEQDKWTPASASSGLTASLRKTVSASPTPSSLSRPDTPTAFGVLDKDEKEEFLRRENELSDQLAERESALAAREKVLNELKDEVAFLKEQEMSLMKENKTSTADASELRILNARLETEIKDQTISLDTFKDQVADLKREIDEQKAEIDERKKVQSREKEEEKEKRKQEMLNEMMAKIDMGGVNLDAAGEKLRLHIKKVEDSSSGQEHISTELRDLVRNHFAENQNIMRDYQERLRLAQDNADLQSKRKAEIEKLLDQRNREYEDLLARSTESNDPLAVAEVKERLEAKWAAQEDMLKGEIRALTEHADKSASEIRRLQSTIETYKLGNEELNRALEAASSGHEDGEKFATAARDLERQRKQYDIQYAEFEIVRKSLMKDLQNRCEKVVELEMQLDEVREQYKVVARSASSRNQQKKLEFLEHNLDALNQVQKQLVDQNTQLKKEVGVAERKLITRNERIQNLEQLLNDADARLAQKNQRYEQQIEGFRSRLAEMQAREQASFNHARIAKPLRGGGGATAAPSNPFANPITRVQHDESPASAKRQSWFFGVNASPRS